MAKSSSANGAGRILAKRYAVALIDVAQTANALQPVEKDILSLENLLATNAQMRDAVGSPVIATDSMLAVFRDIGASQNFHQLTQNFLGVLGANRRLNSLGAIIQSFKSEMAARAGVLEAQIRAAQPLTSAQEQNLVKTLSAKTGKNVKLSVSIDPSLLGGLVVTVGSTMIDDSVKSKLGRLQTAMTQAKAA